VVALATDGSLATAKAQAPSPVVAPTGQPVPAPSPVLLVHQTPRVIAAQRPTAVLTAPVAERRTRHLALMALRLGS
jgi:hypothetical protein